ncbi:hypothetical protein D1AOALGA4SA_1086 [Olavius algarvensis Delta 1 endosymbiont]|nr:hypothetical protein D1AOALGA4SA_1086 [Olavius algarvensis Delta 1 endosymbiont]
MTLMRFYKFQISKSKLQINHKSQITNFNQIIDLSESTGSV